jgi:hypothetical protein
LNFLKKFTENRNHKTPKYFFQKVQILYILNKV